MPAISLLGTDYASLDAWWDAEKDNDYSGAGPILEVPAGLGAMLSANEQFRLGSASQYTIRAVSGAEYDGDYSSTTGKAVLDCGGFELDFREDNITFEDIVVRNFTTDSSGDSHNNLTFRRCMVDGYINFSQLNTASGMLIEDSQVVLNSGDASGQTNRVVYLQSSGIGLTTQRSTIINLAGGSSYACLHNRDSSSLTLNQNVIYSASNDTYSEEFGTPPAPTAANNCANDANFPGSTITNIDTTVFVDFAGGNYQIVGDSGPASQTSPAGAFVQAVVNQDPVLDTPNADISIQTGQVGSIDFGSNFSDTNAGDVLSFSITPDISLQTGWSWNSSTGVASYDGSQQVAAAADYTISASDGNGGTDATDVVSIEVTPPVFTVDTVSDSTPDVGSQITVDFSNAQGAITTGDFNIASQNASQVVIDIPNPTTFILSGQTYPTLPFSADVNIQLSDGTTTDDVVVQIQPETGYVYGEITDIHADGYYADVPGLATGMFAYARVTSGDVVFDVADGRGSAGAGGGTVEIQFYNGEWGDVATITYGEAGADTTAPAIYLIGAQSITVQQNDPYVEQGAIYLDNVDGSGNATVGGDTVNTAALGTYMVTYDYTDAAGNAAPQKTRLVTVTDQPVQAQSDKNDIIKRPIEVIIKLIIKQE